jgi:hypothetical protein
LGWLGDVEWAAWAQAGAALVALSFGPTALQSIWNRFYYSFTAVSKPLDIKVKNGADRWTITIRNRSERMRSLETLIYPRRPGNLIAFAAVETGNDGGLNIDTAVLEGGALRLKALRFGPKREVDIAITFVSADIPRFDQKPGMLKDKLDVITYRGRAEKSGVILLGHTRVMVLMMNFIAATVIIVAHMIYLKLFG